MEENAVVFQTPARVDAHTVQNVEAELGKLADASQGGIVVDMGQTRYLSSAGLRLFSMLQKRMSREGRDLWFRNVNGMIREIFDVTGFSGIFQIE